MAAATALPTTCVTETRTPLSTLACSTNAMTGRASITSRP
jgi:hypothetical protein